jgi:hypothetical protein
MSNKEEKQPYLLQDEEHLGEYEEIKSKVFKLDNPKEAGEFEDELERKPEKVEVDPKNNTATVTEDDLTEDEVNEYKETEGFHFDKLQIKGQDEKKFLEFLQAVADGKVDVGSVSLGAKGDLTIQKAHYDPSLNNKGGKIITAESFLKMVNNFNRIDLSESEIITILEETQNPKMTKAELIETIENNLISEARMNQNVERSFNDGNHDYSEIINTDLAKNLANQSFQEIVQNIRQKTGNENVSMNDVQQLMGNSLMRAAKKEYEYGIDRLERKAVDMIKKQFKIPNNAVDFEATITGINPMQLGMPSDISPEQAEQVSRQAGMKVGKINREGLKMVRGNKEIPQGKTEGEMKPKVKRRRLVNAMMHGAARKSQNLHHMDDELRQEAPQLGRDYANVMAANDASYWMMDDETIRQQGEQGIHAGNVRIKLSDQEGGKPKIIAQGMIFPILLHELSKGVVELMSLWSLPQDRDVRQYVLDKTDNLESETNDIRLGPIIWSKFVEQIPVDNQEVISLTWNMLQELSDHDFNSIVDGLLEDSTNAQTKVRRMAEDALEELQQEASDDEFGRYDDSPEKEEEPTMGNDEEEDDVLTPPEGGVDITPNPIDDEPTEIDYESMSTRDLTSALDDALDAGDMDLVRHIGGILNSK